MAIEINENAVVTFLDALQELRDGIYLAREAKDRKLFITAVLYQRAKGICTIRLNVL